VHGNSSPPREGHDDARLDDPTDPRLDAPGRPSECDREATGDTICLRRGSLESESCAPWEAQRPAAFKLRGTFTVGVWQAQGNRFKLGGMPVDEFARYAERARQFADVMSGQSSESIHTRKRRAQLSRRAPTIAAKSSAPSLQYLQSLLVDLQGIRSTPRDAWRDASLTLGDHCATRGVQSR